MVRNQGSPVYRECYNHPRIEFFSTPSMVVVSFVFLNFAHAFLRILYLSSWIPPPIYLVLVFFYFISFYDDEYGVIDYRSVEEICFSESSTLSYLECAQSSYTFPISCLPSKTHMNHTMTSVPACIFL